MRVRFWGVRGSYPVPGSSTNLYGGNTACVQVCTDDGSTLIIDAGTGIRKLGQELMSGPLGQGQGSAHLLISHTHWDHIQGIPFFAPLYVKGNKISFYARQRDAHLRTIFSSQTEDPYFPVNLDEVAADVSYCELVEGSQFSVGAVKVSCARLNHPFIAIGYRLDADGASLAYVSDTAPFDSIVFGQQFIPVRPNLDQPLKEEDARQLREMRQGVVELCRGCDLVIYDTMFRMDEYLERPHWGHSSPEHAIELLEEAGAACLALFHYAPDRDDHQVAQDEQEIQERTGIEVVASAEGMILEVGGGVRRVK